MPKSKLFIIPIPILMLILILILILITLFILHKKKEGFISNQNTLILLGDSVLYNNPYVEKGKAVTDFLQNNQSANKKYKKKNIYCLAENDATINDIYEQLDNIPIDANALNANALNANITLFLSVGGNDILQLSPTDKNTNTNILIETCHRYKKLIETIQQRFPHMRLVLLNVYYPTTIPRYYTLIKKWNTFLINEYDYDVLDLTQIMTEPTDFTFNIEPSVSGGEKISEKILEYA